MIKRIIEFFKFCESRDVTNALTIKHRRGKGVLSPVKNKKSILAKKAYYVKFL